MPRFVRVTFHNAGRVTLMELADGEQFVACGIEGAQPWIATAIDVTDDAAQQARDAGGLHVANRDN